MACEKIRTQDISYEIRSKSFGNHFKKLVPLQNSWEIIVFSLQSFNTFFIRNMISHNFGNGTNILKRLLCDLDHNSEHISWVRIISQLSTIGT